MQLNEPDPPERAEALVLGGITVATWVLVVALAVVAGETRRGTDLAELRSRDAIDSLRRLPASRQTFHVEQCPEPEEEEPLGP